MHRSAVKTGLYDHRNRGSARRRDRGKRLYHAPAPNEQLQGWLEEHVALTTAREIREFDRKNYLQQTGNLDLTPGERLRQLAIFVEHWAFAVDQPEGWHAIRTIYEEALKLDAPDVLAHIHHSMAISGLGILREAPLEAEVRDQIGTECISHAFTAVDMAPDQATTHSILGQCYYEMGRLPDAIDCFRKGIAADPTYGWPALYLGHVYRDLEQWDRAIAAYDAVPLDFFKGGEAFRVDLLKEMRAWCRLQRGDRKQALQEFLALLDRYEAQINHARNALGQGHFLVSAAAGPLRAELHSRALALVKELDFACCIEILEGN